MKMKEYKNYRIKCPLCGLLSWTSRLNEDYNLQIYEQKLNRWTKSLQIIPVEIDGHFKEAFRSHFLNVLLNLMQHGLIDVKYIREMLGLIERKEVTYPERKELTYPERKEVTYPSAYSFEKPLQVNRSLSIEKPLSVSIEKPFKGLRIEKDLEVNI